MGNSEKSGSAAHNGPEGRRTWWQDAIFYQIYPRSFADGNGDGIGDFPGMTAQLDYLAKLGVGAVWLSPHYPSPMLDCGYDVSDYISVAPEYGSMDDFKAFLAGAHERGIKVVLDLVLNHCSDKHPWFIESASSRDNPKADWFVWKDPAPDGDPAPQGGPPTDWPSFFVDSAWTYVEARKQYYYHIFMEEQPDLNWRNPEVRRAIYDAARFWLDMGVDGFRLDAVGSLFENPAYPMQGTGHRLHSQRMLNHAAVTPAEKKEAGRVWQRMFRYQMGMPGIHDAMKELRAVLDEYPGDRVLIGEDDNIRYLGRGDDELHMVFNFPLMKAPAITPAAVLKNQRQRLALHAALPVPGWPCNTLGNHDSTRLYTRFGQSKDLGPERLARLNAALMLTLRGTPVLYNGGEIGMEDYIIPDLSKLRDTVALWRYKSLTEEFGMGKDEAAGHACAESRDRCRTPMQWGPGPHADFCPPQAQPWLPLGPSYARGVNVTQEDADPASLLNFYRRLGTLRRKTPALRAGSWEARFPAPVGCLVYLRRAGDESVLVALNYSGKKHKLSLEESAQILFLDDGQNIVVQAEERALEASYILGPGAVLIARVAEG